MSICPTLGNFGRVKDIQAFVQVSEYEEKRVQRADLHFCCFDGALYQIESEV